MITGQQVAEAARKYCGVPITEGGRSREGIDCVGLVLCVAHDLELNFPQSITGYGLNIWLHPRVREARELMGQCMDEVRGRVQTGDVVLFGFGRSAIANSVGIVTETELSAIKKLVGGLHELGAYFAEYDFMDGRCTVAGCYRFRELAGKI
jgi:cell wall-associated NlpC family hydrolase